MSQLKTETKVKRMNINIEASLHTAFKSAAAARNENMTDVLLKHIQDYVDKYGVKPAKKGRP